jgi:hypothetical protein
VEKDFARKDRQEMPLRMQRKEELFFASSAVFLRELGG